MELPGLPKGDLYFKNLSMSNEEKNPERGVTQINDQKKLRMKGEKSTPSFLLNTHTGLIYYKEPRDMMAFSPLTPFSFFLSFLISNLFPSGPSSG